MSQEETFTLSSLLVAANRFVNFVAYGYVLNQMYTGKAAVTFGNDPITIFTLFTPWVVVSELRYLNMLLAVLTICSYRRFRLPFTLFASCAKYLST